MQTFLPTDDYSTSAQSLDLSRLGKQVIEAGQIVRSLNDPTYGWKNHPATKMWDGHSTALLRYTEAVTDEWYERRGKIHGAWTNLLTWLEERDMFDLMYGDDTPPDWFGDDAVHLSHRSNLVRKLPEHYGPLWPDVPSDLEYVWPVK